MKKNVFGKLLLFLLLALGAFSISGCGADTVKARGKTQDTEQKAEAVEEKTEEPAEAAAEKVTVSIADFKVYPASCQIIIADKKGFFEKEFSAVGADYKITKFLNGPAVNEAFASKAVDFTAIGALPGITGINNTRNQKIIGNDLTNFGEAIITYEGSGVESVSDLKGKKLGFAVGTADQTLINEILADYDLTINDIVPVNVAEEAERENAIISRNTEAILIYEPYLSSILESQGDLKVLATNEKHGSVVPLVARTDFVDAHPEVAQAFVNAIQDANDWLAENGEEAVTIVSQETGVDEASIKTTLEKNKYDTVLSDEDLTELGNVVEYLKGEGNLESDFEVEEFIDKSFYGK